MYILIGNYGNESIALLQWCIEHSITPLTVLNVNTGWAAATWQSRVATAQQYAEQHGISVKQIDAPYSFTQLVHDRKQFPTKKFQWCASFLKGLALNQYLDEIDPSCEAILLFGKRKAASNMNHALPSNIASSEYYNQRPVWFPLINCDEATRNSFIKRAGFPILPHASLECSPCIHSNYSSLQQLSDGDIAKTATLEQHIQQHLFDPAEFGEQQGIGNCVKWARLQPKDNDNALQNYVGCGSPWGCGE